MQVPKQEYSLDSFLETISDNVDEIFGIEEQRQWLKIYLMIADDRWTELFEQYKPEKLGDIYHIPMPFGEDDNNKADYYVYELEKGLLMFFTSSKRDEYNKTLLHFVRHHTGINEMWLPPNSFDEVISYVKSTYDGHIYSFTAERPWSSKFPSKKRPDFSRLIRYSADDADYTLKELKELYGVLPSLVDFKIGLDKIRITNFGMFFCWNINRTILRMVEEVIDKVIGEQRRLRSVSKQVEYTKKQVRIGDSQMNVPSIMSARIVLSGSLNGAIIEKLFKNFQDDEIGRSMDMPAMANFSFIDTGVKEGALSYSATIVDEDKGTIFGLSGSERDMILIPKHRTTFESFINFFRLINEKIDESSNLHLFSENIAR